MPGTAVWMGVDLAGKLTLTIGTGDGSVEIETWTAMDPGVIDVGTLTATKRGVAVAIGKDAKFGRWAPGQVENYLFGDGGEPFLGYQPTYRRYLTSAILLL